MKKIFILILFFYFSNAFAAEFVTNFTKEAFQQAQNNGRTVVVYSWNKYCASCAKQKPIISQAKKDFDEVLFLYIEHVKNKELVKQELYIETHQFLFWMKPQMHWMLVLKKKY